MENKITKLEINKLWGEFDLEWNEIHPDVNILIGINGGGKSTILRILRDCVKMHSKLILKKYKIDGCRATMSNDEQYSCGGHYGANTCVIDSNVKYINIFEPGVTKLKKEESILDYQLDRLLYQRDTSVDNFTNFRLKASYGENREESVVAISEFFKVVNTFFKKTDKTIEVSTNNVEIQFRNSSDTVVEMKFLSSGEKQLLIMLLQIFLMDKKPYIVVFDEPETSMHIEWQQMFISAIQELNPNMQLFISTHSPSIFGDGWNDKLFFVEDFVINN